MEKKKEETTKLPVIDDQDVKASFVVVERTEQLKGGLKIVLEPASSFFDDQQKFWVDAPKGKINMEITNVNYHRYFGIGDEFHLTFEKYHEVKKAKIA